MNNHVRAISLCGAMVVLMLLLGGQRAHAQIDCACHLVQIHADSNLLCSVQVCLSGVAWTECKLVAPGTDTVISCPSGGNIVIVDGCGQRQQVPVGGCLYNIPGPAPCCIDACLRVNEFGCLQLNLGRGAAGHCFCPGG